MASVTLAESAKLDQDEMTQGLIEAILTVDRFYQNLPFDGLDGNALAYNRENTLGTVAAVAPGEDIGPTVSTGNNQAERLLGKDAATFTQVTASLITLMGDAEVDQRIQATRSKTNDQTGVQVASKAKAAGRKYQDMLINGVAGATNEFPGMLTLVPAGQKVTTATNGSALTLALLDELLDKVTDKDGEVDYIMMPRRTLRAYYELLRQANGASITEVVTLPNGKTVPAYRGHPIYVNDNIPTDQVQGSSGSVCTTIFAGNFDDGSRTIGIAGLSATTNMGLHAVDIGHHHTKDQKIWRVKWYCGLALFSELGIASMSGILD